MKFEMESLGLYISEEATDFTVLIGENFTRMADTAQVSLCSKSDAGQNDKRSTLTVQSPVSSLCSAVAGFYLSEEFKMISLLQSKAPKDIRKRLHIGQIVLFICFVFKKSYIITLIYFPHLK